MFVIFWFNVKGVSTVLETYGNLDNVAIITLAPEKENALKVIQELSDRNVTVSVGHSMANLTQGEAAINHGAKLITHLFNAMLPVCSNFYPKIKSNSKKLFFFLSFTIVIQV